MQDPEDRDSPRIKAQAHPEHMALIPARQNPVRPNQMRQNLVTLGVVLAWWVARLLSPDDCCGCCVWDAWRSSAAMQRVSDGDRAARSGEDTDVQSARPGLLAAAQGPALSLAAARSRQSHAAERQKACCIVLGGCCCNGPMLHIDPRAQVLGPSTSPQQHARPLSPTTGCPQLPCAAGTRPTSACC